MACLACAAAASSTTNPPHIQSPLRGRPSNAAQSRPRAAPPLPLVASRRGFGLAAALSILTGGSIILRAEEAAARDIPLFGLRKRVKEAIQEEVKEVEKKVQEVEKDVKEIVKESSAAVATEAKAVLAASASSMDASSSSFTPAVQAGAVVAVELLGLAIASSVVSGLVSQPSK